MLVGVIGTIPGSRIDAGSETDHCWRMTEYREKLKDPRWQKKRLQILQRDEFICQCCFDSESTLHVHHKYYNNCDPWDIPDSALVTLCAECHEEEGNCIKDTLHMLRRVIADCGGMSSDIDVLIQSLAKTSTSNRPLFYMEWCVLANHIESLLESRLNNGSAWEKARKKYAERLRNKIEAQEKHEL